MYHSIVIGVHGLKSAEVWALQDALYDAHADYNTLKPRVYIAWFDDPEDYQDSVSWWSS